MTSYDTLSRRGFLALTAAAPLMSAASSKSKIPVGLELYSVRNQFKQDVTGTIRGVAKMGYQGVEFFASYLEWKTDYAKEIRKLLDELKLPCFSTHNGSNAFSAERLPHTIEINQILGSKYVVMASAGKVEGLDGWKKVAGVLNEASEKLGAAGLGVGYHNHAAEFRPIDGKRPMEILAADTNKKVMLQLDVGTCVEAGSDPVEWINANPGRIRSMHCKDWSSDPDKGYKVLFGEGKAPWKQIFQAAEKAGGIEYYLIEQEGSRFPEMETAERCLASFRKIHGK